MKADFYICFQEEKRKKISTTNIKIIRSGWGYSEVFILTFCISNSLNPANMVHSIQNRSVKTSSRRDINIQNNYPELISFFHVWNFYFPEYFIVQDHLW